MELSTQSKEVLITLRETQERLHVGRTTLSELTRSGKIRTVRIGPRGIRVPVAEIERFVRETLGDTQAREARNA